MHLSTAGHLVAGLHLSQPRRPALAQRWSVPWPWWALLVSLSLPYKAQRGPTIGHLCGTCRVCRACQCWGWGCRGVRLQGQGAAIAGLAAGAAAGSGSFAGLTSFPRAFVAIAAGARIWPYAVLLVWGHDRPLTFRRAGPLANGPLPMG